jgi:hypothetical protein
VRRPCSFTALPLSTGRRDADEKTREYFLAFEDSAPEGAILTPKKPRFNDFFPLLRFSPTNSALSPAREGLKSANLKPSPARESFTRAGEGFIRTG